MSLILVGSPRFADHLTPPGHVESAARADVMDAIADRWRNRGGVVLDPVAATGEQLRRVHDAAYVDRIAATAGRATMLDPDTYTSPESALVARLAAGSGPTALAHFAAAPGSAARALALVRPPGHHARRDEAMGFCLFNNVAVTAAEALARGVPRVAIVDYDVHHGNGTQDIFEDDPRVLFISTHQYPFYPGTGAATDVGRGPGTGFTVNVPIEGGATDGDYLELMEAVVLPILRAFDPGLVIVSAGFDAHESDPLGQMRVTTSGYGELTAALHRACGDRPLIAVTEGGYDLAALGACLQRVVETLARDPAEVSPPASLSPATGRGDRARALVGRAQAGRWAGL